MLFNRLNSTSSPSINLHQLFAFPDNTSLTNTADSGAAGASGSSSYSVRDLWARRGLGTYGPAFSPPAPGLVPHAGMLYSAVLLS
jgi:hypothetical protein